MTTRRTPCATATLLLATAVHADTVVGVSLSTTGPSVSLGIMQKNPLVFYPDTVDGEELRLAMVDDAFNPSIGMRLVRKLVTGDHVDIIVGSSAMAPSTAIAEVATESHTPQLALASAELKSSKGDWIYRLAQPISLMVGAIATCMAVSGAKNVGSIGSADAYGGSWLKDFTAAATPRGIKIIDIKHYARADISVTGQVTKLVSIKPDAVSVAGAGMGAALSHTALRDRGYVGSIYQTHSAATKGPTRIDGKAVDGAILPAGPVIVVEQLPDSHPSKKTTFEYVTRYEKTNGPDMRAQFDAHTWDALQVPQHIVPVALKKVKPGTLELRQVLKNALESEHDIVVPYGALNYTVTDHFGLDARSRMLLAIDHGGWKLLNRRTCARMAGGRIADDNRGVPHHRHRHAAHA